MKKLKFSHIKEKVISEATLFFVYFLFIAVFLGTFTLYERLVLDSYSIHYAHYGYSIFESLILAKIILIGQSLKLGEKFSEQPLFISTLYKTLIFSCFVIIFSVGEHFLIGFLEGHSFLTIYHHLLTRGGALILAQTLIMFFVFFFFFAFIELGRVLGGKYLLTLFFKSRK